MPTHPIGRAAVVFGTIAVVAMLVAAAVRGFENIPERVRLIWMVFILLCGVTAALFDDPIRFNDRPRSRHQW